MVSNLRAEAGHSLAVAQGVNTESTLKYLLKRTQEELWTAFVWPELGLRNDLQMNGGIWSYDYGPELKFDAIREAWAAVPGGNSWSPVHCSITEDKLVPQTQVNSTSGDPVQYWESFGNKFARLADAAAVTWLRFKGNRDLEPLVANRFFDLDATVIILFTASELLARSRPKTANKLQKAQRHLTKLLGNQVSAKNKISSYGWLRLRRRSQ
jgi:hypothetical protein